MTTSQINIQSSVFIDFNILELPAWRRDSNVSFAWVWWTRVIRCFIIHLEAFLKANSHQSQTTNYPKTTFV